LQGIELALLIRVEASHWSHVIWPKWNLGGPSLPHPPYKYRSCAKPSHLKSISIDAHHALKFVLAISLSLCIPSSVAAPYTQWTSPVRKAPVDHLPLHRFLTSRAPFPAYHCIYRFVYFVFHHGSFPFSRDETSRSIAF